MPEADSVAIIGLGSRGLSVLERILALAGQSGEQLRIDLVDPVGDGAGLHAMDQPDYLLLNTICSQVTMFPSPATVGDTVWLTGPSLYEWAVERELRIAADGFTVGTGGRPIRPWDFLRAGCSANTSAGSCSCCWPGHRPGSRSGCTALRRSASPTAGLSWRWNWPAATGSPPGTSSSPSAIPTTSLNGRSASGGSVARTRCPASSSRSGPVTPWRSAASA